MSEKTTPAHTGDETVAAAGAPLSEAENGIADPLTIDASQEDETSETTPSGQLHEADHVSEVTGPPPAMDAGDSSAVASEREPSLPDDQEAIVDDAEISESATEFIAEAWAPDDAAQDATEPASGEAPGGAAEVTATAADSADTALESSTEAVDDAGISERATEFIAEAWAPGDEAPPAGQDSAQAVGVASAGEAAGIAAEAGATVSAAADAVREATTEDTGDVSASAADFIAEAWVPDDAAQPESDASAADGVQAVAENEDAPPAEPVNPETDTADSTARPTDAVAEQATGVEGAPVSDSEEPAFDGGELVAEAQEEEVEPAEAAEPAVGGADIAARAEEPATEGSAPDSGAGTAESEIAAEAASEEPLTATSAEPVLAADAIAATAIASNEEAQKEQEAEAAPVIVDRELTWGFVDTEGRIHQSTTEHFRGRSIGKVIGSGDLQIAEFESNFGPLAKEVEVLEAEVITAKNKVAVMGRVRKMKSTAGRAEALGDFEDLFARLHALEATIQTEIDERRARKEVLIEKAEEIKDSTEWKVTGEAYKELFQEWKQVGATGREADDVLWARFIGAREHFNTRRGEHFNQRQEQWEGNRLLKQDVIVRAHELSTSDQWRPTSDALRALFDEWKKIGSAGRQSDEELWQQFRGAQQHFYDRRNAAYDEHRQRKEQLCQRAEDLRDSTDWNATVEEMKAMMADWKTVGTSGKRDVDDALWNRFRGAQNAFFDKRYAEASAREQQERSQSHQKEEIAAAIEQLAYSPDAVAAGEQALALRAQFEALPSIRRDREEQLERRIRKAMGDIRVNAAAEGARRSVSWQGKLREALERSQDQIESLNQTVATQETSLEELRTKLETAGDDEKPELDQQIQELYESLSYNQAEIERLKGSMSDISDNVQV